MNNNVTWVLEKNVFSEKCFDQMVKTFLDKSIPFHLIKVIPFEHVIAGDIPETSGHVVIYGSLGFRLAASKCGWSNSFWTGPELDEHMVKERLSENYLNHDSIVCKFKDVPNHFVNSNYKDWADLLFVKPNEDNKNFTGEVFSRADFLKWIDHCEKYGYAGFDGDMEVVVSRPKTIGKEWRFVIVGGKISAASQYKDKGRLKVEPGAPEDVVDFVNQMISEYNPLPAFVIDVCENGGKYKVVELNTFNNAGFYDCDVESIINDVNSMLMEK